jgi:hypothetical protein
MTIVRQVLVLSLWLPNCYGNEALVAVWAVLVIGRQNLVGALLSGSKTWYLSWKLGAQITL